MYNKNDSIMIEWYKEVHSMEVMLIVGLFASSALSLNFIVNQKYKLAGSMNIINLC